jgi:two-component system, cell cycle sensor histidine kinase and response regulator CckA
LKSFQSLRVRDCMDSARKGKVLLVEDDDQVRSFIRMLLTSNGYEVLEASTGAEGLEIAERQSADIDLLLSDMLLPELSGYDLAMKVQELRPKIKILFMTGYVEGEIVQRSMSELGATFLDKPFQPATLLARVEEAIKAHPHEEEEVA